MMLIKAIIYSKTDHQNIMINIAQVQSTNTAEVSVHS